MIIVWSFASSPGLLHMGKGLMTLNPYHSDGVIVNKTAVAGLLAVLHSAFDMKNSLLNKRHYILMLSLPLCDRAVSSLSTKNSNLYPYHH